MSFLLDVLTRRFEVAHASNPNYDEQSKENSTNSNCSYWVHGWEMWIVWISVIISFSFFPAVNEDANYSNTETQRFVKQKGSQAAHLPKKAGATVKNAMQLGIVGLLLKGTVTRNLSKSKQSKLTPNWVKLTKVKKIIKTDWNCGFQNLLNESRNINKGQYF